MKAVPLIFFVILCFISVRSAGDNKDVWDDWVTPSQFNLFPTLPIAAPLSADEKCRKESRELILNLRNKTLWAMQMWDASATAAFGILHGNKFQFGNYDECLAVSEPIKTHYCRANIQAIIHQKEAFEGDPYDLDPRPNTTVWKKIADSRRDLTKYARDESLWGLCVPLSCNASEIEKAINHYLTRLNEDLLKSNETTYRVEIEECNDGAEEEFSYGEMGFWIFTCTVFVLIIAATTVDMRQKKDSMAKDGKGKKLLMAFSLKRNLASMKSANDEPEMNHIKFLYGIRCMSIALIVIDHHVAIFLTSAMFNRERMEEVLRSYQTIFLPQGDLVIDTFFFMGGYLVTCTLLNSLEKMRLNAFFVIFYRFLRLAPLYFYIIWFQSSVLLRFGSGPVWKKGLQEEVEFCRKNWWANILFIQNYVNPKEMCMLHAWYLPCDFHFFILTVLLVLAIKKNKKYGVILLQVITFISVFIPGIVTYIYELKPLIPFNPKFVDKPRMDLSFELLYIKSHTRATVYLLGVLTAYYIFEKRRSTWKISRSTSIFVLLGGLCLLFAPMAYSSLYYNPRKQYNLAESATFAVLRRLSWGLGWVIFMIISRFGVIPLFGRIFSWNVSVLLSKTTYGIYLVHFVMQMADEAKVRIPYQFISFDMVVKGTSDLFVATCYAFILYLFVELPFRLIFKELLFPLKKKAEVKVPQELNDVVVKKENSTSPIFSVKL